MADKLKAACPKCRSGHISDFFTPEEEDFNVSLNCQDCGFRHLGNTLSDFAQFFYAPVVSQDELARAKDEIDGLSRQLKEQCELHGATLDDFEKAEQQLAAAQSERDEAVKFLRILNEETMLAGYPGGDRAQTLANIREMMAKTLGPKP